MSSLNLSSMFQYNSSQKQLHRNSTFLKVSKRFSSLLKTKPTAHQKLDTIFPPEINVSKVSLVSCESIDSDDDELVTPTTSHTAISIMDNSSEDKLFIEDITASTKLEIMETAPVEEEILSFPSMVREELKRVFEETDLEIEKELMQSRYELMEAIRAKPRFKYY